MIAITMIMVVYFSMRSEYKMLFLVKDPPGQRPSGSTTRAGERFLNY